jgi:hypothetical protein
MESSTKPPTRDEAAAALAQAESTRARFAGDIVLPSWFAASIGAAISVQIATTAVGLGNQMPWLVATGVSVFAVVGVLQLLRFRRLNGVWLGSLAGRVVLGGGTLASLSYAAALAVAIWAAFGARWWLMALASLLGGAGYALAGRHWMHAYRGAPHEYGRGDSAAWLTAVSAVAVIGMVLLVLGR